MVTLVLKQNDNVESALMSRKIFHRSDQVFHSDGDGTVMNDIDDDRDELAFAQLDLARYHSMLDLGHVRRHFETVLQDQHLLRCVGARFGVPGIAGV